MVWAAVYLLCVVHVSLFCVSFLYAGGTVLVPGTECGAVRSMLLRGAAYRTGIRRQAFQRGVPDGF